MEKILRGAAIILALAGALCAASGCRSGREGRTEGTKLVEISRLTGSDYRGLAEWLDGSAEDPVSYIVEKCREHQLVIIGEQHCIKDYVELFIRAIPDAYHKGGVRVIAMEAINAEDNERLARLVEGESYDSATALDIARSHDWGLWGYKEYWDILEAVWKFNRSLPDNAEHLRLVGIDKKMDYQLDTMWRAKALKDPALIEKAKAQPDLYKRDDWLTANVEKEIMDRGERGLLLIGLHHAFTNYAQPVVNRTTWKLEREWARMANILYRKYNDKVFEIALHGPHSSPSMIDKNYKGDGPVFDTKMEAIMEAHGNEPVGFDVVGSPFAPFRDNGSYYFHWQPTVSFADLCPGFIFIKPYKELSPTTWLDGYVSDEMFEKGKAFYEFSYGRKFSDSREINEFFRSGQGEL